MKSILAVNIGKSISLGLKLCKFGSGTSMPGLIASKISPEILTDLINQTKKEIITVTGTNGKTTTANFVSAILKSAGRKVANNAKGANMLQGVITAMVENANCFARLDADNSVIEADEAYLQIMADYFSADYLIVTNLFQDQLDRYGEVDATAKMIQNAINKFKNQKQNFKTILNADDPTIQNLADENTLFFGFEDIKFNFEHENSAPEIVKCKCGKNFEFSRVYYGHIGHYSCLCGEKRPDTYLKATADVAVNSSVLHITNPVTNEEFSVAINMPGVYNAYNALGAITLAVKTGVASEDIIKAFENYKTVFGRAEKCVLQGKNALVQLIKNPVGAEEVFKIIRDDKSAKILIAINDNYGDGRDVSWLWDTNFELLKDYDKKIVVSGLRAYDTALRFKYAGINEENLLIEQNLKKALQLALDNTSQDETLYIVPCYTALLDMQKIVSKM